MTTSALGRLDHHDLGAGSVADLLVKIGSIGIGADDQYTFASGLKSPVYCDNRLLLSRVDERQKVVNELVRLIRETPGVEHDAIAGVASAGIPFAAWVAHDLKAPMAYIRPAAKDHGTMKRVEGGLAMGTSVALVEDLVTTGDSALSAIEALHEAGLQCEHCFSIVDYGFDFAAAKFAAAGVTLHTLVDTPSIMDAADKSDRYSPEYVARVKAWHGRVNATGGRIA